MKTELRPAAHQVLPGQTVVEIWHDDQFIGQITGADGAGVRILSKYAKRAVPVDGMVLEVKIDSVLAN